MARVRKQGNFRDTLKPPSKEEQMEQLLKYQLEHPAPPSKPKYAKLSLTEDEALVLLTFIDNMKTTRKDWHKLEAIHSKLYKAHQKVKYGE